MISLFLSVCLFVCAPFHPYNSKTVTPIELKFDGQVFHGVQMDSSKFGFLIFNWDFTVKSASLINQ